jgi:hypothetical protein
VLVASTPRFAGVSPLFIMGSRPDRRPPHPASGRALPRTRPGSRELHHLPGGAQFVPPGASRSVTVVRSRLAEAIWLAIARFQIRS